MSTLTTSHESVTGDGEVDRGLRSVQGIRWLLLAGALVVAVSVIRLVAAEWGALPAAARFLTLALGALAVFAAGDVTRRRLRLPVAGSALLFLGVALVPLLAWGAAYLRLLEAPFGWPSLILGLAPLATCADRTLRGLVALSGGAYAAASGVMLFALPVLPYLEGRWPWSAETFFLIAAVALGLLLRSASRHVNRFFFHRDRLAGVERPVHWLPFASLVLYYAAGTSLLTAFSSHLAVPLAFVALALIDAGEEYHRALVRAAGERPERWPWRSRALLALGFTALAASLLTAPLDAGRHSLALVSSIASVRLLAWAWRGASTAAHVAGLLASIVAYHTAPAFMPEAVRDLFQQAVAALGVYPASVGALTLGDLGMVAQLLALGWLMRGRLTPAMCRAHALITAGFASLVLFVALFVPEAGRWVAPAAALLLGAGLIALRWRILIPAFFQALATAILAWAYAPAWPAAREGLLAALALAGLNLLFLGSAWLIARRRGEQPLDDVTTRLVAWPPLALAWLFFPWALVAWDDRERVTAGLLVLAAAATFAASALIRRRAWLLPAVLGSLFVWVPLAAQAIFAGGALAATAAGWLALAVAARAAAGELARRGRDQPASTLLLAALAQGVLAGCASIVATLDGAGSPWPQILPGFLASAFFAFLGGCPSLRTPPRTVGLGQEANPKDSVLGALAAEGRRAGGRTFLAALATGLFTVSSGALVSRIDSWGPELYCLGPGLALLGLSGLLRREIGRLWRQRLFTAGATLLYAMPVLGLLDELAWGWQIVLLLFAVAFGAASFQLRSRPLLITSTAALIVDLACFLIKLRQTAPLLVWVAGIVFGLGLMAAAALLEHRREVLLQRIRIWGRELRSWA